MPPFHSILDFIMQESYQCMFQLALAGLSTV